MTNEKNNFSHLGGNMYLVRTQAGFRQALKHWENFIDGAGIDNLVGFPVSYPSLITINSKYRGVHHAEVETITFNDVRAAMDKSDADFRNSDTN